MLKSRTMLLSAVAGLALGAAAAHADVVIATAGPMTGQYAVFGDQMRRGAEMAVKDLNAKGGINGEKVQLVVGDDACDPKQAVAVANDFVNKDVVFVAGHYCSGSSIPASDVYHEEGILMVSPASTNPKLTEQGYDNVFRICGRDDQQGEVAANYIVDQKVGDRIAVLDDRTAYGKGLADELVKNLEKRGVKPVMREAITAGDKDFTALITKMKQANVNLIYLGGYHTEAGLITRQAHEQGLKALLMAGDALVTDEYWAITGDTGQGTLMTFSPDPRRNPDAADVLAEFKKVGYDPEGYTLYTYAAVQVFAEAAAKAKSTDLDKILPVMHDTSFDTVIGPVKFDSKGDKTGSNYVVYKWDAGQYHEID
jgi:branched-chain amino acid transport system substrate-binding protein